MKQMGLILCGRLPATFLRLLSKSYALLSTRTHIDLKGSMGTNSLVLEKAVPEMTLFPQAVHKPAETVAPSGEYSKLICRLFGRQQSVIAFTSCASTPVATEVCEIVAVKLGASGKRVVVVPAERLLRMNAPAKEAVHAPWRPNVWLWPSTADGNVELFKSGAPTATEDSWLECLRRDFDSVLLDCVAAEAIPAVAEIAALADVTVIVVEAKRTLKQQIRRLQRALQLSNVNLAGCVLVQGR